MRGLAVAVAAILLATCASNGEAARVITIFAAASLTDCFKAMGAGFEKDHPGTQVNFNFAGSPTLVMQIEQGAKADLFASADTANVDKIENGGYAAGEPEVFAHNQLEIVVAPHNPKEILGLSDLARPDVTYISAGPTVPAGRYAAEALAKASVRATPRSLETDVKSVIGKVELGEADAGIVYTTDVKAAGEKVEGVQIPDGYNVVATYPVVILKASTHPEVARGFIDYVQFGPGLSILVSFGFRPR